VDGKTPYEAAFGKKPDLRGVREWGEKVWVHVEGGNKLGGHVREGRWIGVDDKSKGICVYWPDKKTVSVERNVYYDKTCSSISRLEGEELEEFVETKIDKPVIPPSSSNSTSNPSHVQLSASHATRDPPSKPSMDVENPPSEAETRPR